MKSQNTEGITAYLERAEQSTRAAKDLLAKNYYDFAASRAYYAAFYAATAALWNEGLDLSKHSAVISFVHQRFIKTGKLSKERGNIELAF